MSFIPRKDFPEKGDKVEAQEGIYTLAGKYPRGHQFMIIGYDENGVDLQSLETIQDVKNNKYPSSIPISANYVRVSWEKFNDCKIIEEINPVRLKK
jgi:hypothetical protein